MSKWSRPWPIQRDAVKERSGGVCEVCRGSAEQIHHRQPRAMGGTRRPGVHMPANLLHVCAACHRHIESHRSAALLNGWLVRQGQDPAVVPVLVDRGSRRVFLTADGRYSDDPPEAAA
jgi:hypothetical protein